MLAKDVGTNDLKLHNAPIGAKKNVLMFRTIDEDMFDATKLRE
jgi:hypothetical protein